MNLLRSYIRKILKEKLTSTDMFGSQSDKLTINMQQEVLNKLNAKPIPRGDNETGFLGKGAYAAAYEVLYKGRHSVLKMTVSPPDYQASRKLKLIRSRLPVEIAENLPEIREITSVYAHNEIDERDYKVYVTVVEYLVPLPQGIKLGEFYANDDEFSLVELHAKKWLENQEGLKDIIIDEINKHEAEYSTSDLDPRVKKALLTVALKYTNKMLSIIIEHNIIQIYHLIKGLRDYVVDTYLTDVDPQVLANSIVARIIPDEFPGFHDYEGKTNYQDPRMQDLYDTVKYLKDRNLALWGDLHKDNVMMRPKTGEFVISDYGGFQFLKQKERKQ